MFQFGGGVILWLADILGTYRVNQKVSSFGGLCNPAVNGVCYYVFENG